MSRKIREAKEKAKADKLKQSALDRARREREAFAKKLAAAKDSAKTAFVPAEGIVDDDAVAENDADRASERR